jgi:predicted nucleic acid-binding protein
VALSSAPRYLADKSALARLRHAAVGAVLEPLILTGMVATCGIVELEVLYSATGAGDFDRTRTRRALAFPRIPTLEDDLERATDVMGLLAHSGRHRSAGIPDLVIAAIAERARLTVIHYDQDFEEIAAVTGQSVEWVVPRGSIP